ncbi:unnamed protein product [Thelazia callipaeda]|uniref:Cnd1 domain-containing protein n=1 Tax=Thelazia callipaeda TaxID=103827 RepID=A0A0N5CNP4_THECL|nr:unnamed protein product [Thelazia callipaeda]
MEEKEKLLDTLDNISSIFNEVTDEWTTTCFEENFSEFGNFAQAVQFSILQAFDYSLRLSELCSCLILFANQSEISTEIWNELTTKNFNAKKLCVFAWYLIERGQQSNVSLDEQKLGLIGSRIYFSICCLNGAQAFNIFNDYLFQVIFKFLLNLKSIFSMRLMDYFEQLTLEQQAELKCMLSDALDPLFILLERVSLSRIQQSSTLLAVCLQQLMQIDFSETTSILELERLSDFQGLERFSNRSFALLHRFLDSRHGSSHIVYGRIVMPRLLFWTLENTVFPTNAHPPKLISTYKEVILKFIEKRIQKGCQEELSTALLVLQNVCYRCPDRTDYRVKVTNSVVETLALLPSKYVKDFALFLCSIATSSKVAVRVFSVEILPLILRKFGCVLEQNGVEEPLTSHAPRKETDSDTQIKENVIFDNLVERIGIYGAILVVLARGCNDKSPMVRARALQQIALLLVNENIRHKLLDIPSTMVFIDSSEKIIEKTTGGSVLLNIIITRCLDARVSTRKSAIIAFESLFPYLPKSQQTEFTPIFRQLCRDPSLLVRKQTAESLSHLLILFGMNYDMLDKIWLSSVLPLINDREQSVVQLVSKLVLQTLILPIFEDASPIAWRILKIVEQEVDYRRLLFRCLIHQAKEGDLTENAVNILLKKQGDSDTVNIVWMLLNFLSSIFKIDASLAVRFWYTLDHSMETNLCSYVAEVIASSADRISEKDRDELINNIGTKLNEFSVNEGHISHVYYAFARLCNGVSDESPGAKQLYEFNRVLIEKSLKLLHNTIFSSVDVTGEVQLSQENKSKEQNFKSAQFLVRIVSSVGEAVQYTPNLLNTDPRVFNIMKLIVASDVIQQQLTQTERLDKFFLKAFIFGGTVLNTMPSSYSLRQPASQFVHTKNDKQQLRLEDRSQHAANNTQKNHTVTVSCPSSQEFRVSSQSSNKAKGSSYTNKNQEPRWSQPTIQGSGKTSSSHSNANLDLLCPAVRAQAVLTIGKMCLQDEKLAKKCIPVFSRQLLVNTNHLVRSNIVSVVCDLCKRYTLLVDRHSAIVASCLKDSSTLVRKQTLMLLTHLLKEQYIRWEGQIMYRFVSTILDENKEVRDYAEMCLIDVLLVQFPNMFINHFLECIFYFNSVVHGSWLAMKNVMEEDTKEELKYSLSGTRFKNARLTLYKFMMKTFNDENKFTVGLRISQEVYSSIVDGILDINDQKVKALLGDCYDVMCCPEMKLSMALGKSSSNNIDEDDDEPPSSVQEAAKKVVTQAFRKGIIDAILPHIIQFKYYLQEKRLYELEWGIVRVLRELCKDHCEELDEFLASDKQLKAEIKFDLAKLEVIFHHLEKERRMRDGNKDSHHLETLSSNDKRVSLAADNIIVSPSQLASKTAEEVVKQEEDLVAAVQKVTLSNKADSLSNGVLTNENRKKSIKLEKIVEEEREIDDTKEESVDQIRPTNGIEKNAQTEAPMCEQSSLGMQSRILDEECELPARAISTPKHTMNEARPRRRIRLTSSSTIEEVENERD